MIENLAQISASMISQIIGRAKSLTDSTMLTAINDIQQSGILAYKDMLTTGLSMIALEGIESARKQIPGAKKVKLSESILLSEFDKLPPSLQRKVKNSVILTTDAQMADLEKVIFFQFTSSVDSLSALPIIEKDLQEAAEDYITGAAIEGGAGLQAAQFTNAGRNEFFDDPEVADQVDALQFVNGDPVTPICQDLNGTIFSKDDPEAAKYEPPLHWNCKSYIIPILKGKLGNREILDLKPSKASLDKYVQFCEHGSLDHFSLREIGSPREGSLQTIIVNKSHAKSLDKAKSIAKEFGAEHMSVDETENSYRFRQRNPSDFIDGSFRTHTIPEKGVSLVYGKLKN